MKKQIKNTFTLIEVIAVIVILGILAATVVPKMTDVTLDAEEAMIQACVNQLNSRESVAWATETYGGTKTVSDATVLGKVVNIPGTSTLDVNVFGSDFTFALLDATAGTYTITNVNASPNYSFTVTRAASSDADLTATPPTSASAGNWTITTRD